MIQKYFTVLAACALAFVSFAPAYGQDKEGEENETSKISSAEQIGYFLGLSFGQQLRQSGFRAEDMNMESITAGFTDGLSEKESALTDKELAETQKVIQTLVQDRRQQQVTDAKKKGVAFLTANAKKEGVKELKGGVQYKVLEEGEGDSPKLTDTVKVHYTGKLISGQMFDSSVQRGEPATFRVGQVIKGWQMALQEMKVGSKWMLYIPSELAYGEQGSPGAIGPNQVLVFEVELLEIQ